VRSVAVPTDDGRRVIGAAGIVADAQHVSVTTLLPVLRVAAEKIASDLALSRGRRPAG
jgi:hypothetical protein